MCLTANEAYSNHTNANLCRVERPSSGCIFNYLFIWLKPFVLAGSSVASTLSHVWDRTGSLPHISELQGKVWHSHCQPGVCHCTPRSLVRSTFQLASAGTLFFVTFSSSAFLLFSHIFWSPFHERSMVVPRLGYYYHELLNRKTSLLHSHWETLLFLSERDNGSIHICTCPTLWFRLLKKSNIWSEKLTPDLPALEWSAWVISKLHKHIIIKNIYFPNFRN